MVNTGRSLEYLDEGLVEFAPPHPPDFAIVNERHIFENRTGRWMPLGDWNDRFRGTIRQFWLADAGAASRGYQPLPPTDLATGLRAPRTCSPWETCRAAAPRSRP